MINDLVASARAGDARAVARLISLVENASPQLREAMAALASHSGNAHVIGLTGAPGVGKSTTTSALIREFRERDKTVGVLAVDPSSPFSGGALLGDRIRMQEHATDPGVFIRSMASRGHLGGLSWATPHALRVLDAAGCDVILVETVGVGQSEVEVAALADTVVILLAPAMGDGIQAAKAGILEVGDIYVVNKADRGGAEKVTRDLRSMLNMGERRSDWIPPIRKISASQREGVAEVVDAIDEHWQHLVDSGELDKRRVRRAREEVEAIAVEQLRRQWSEATAREQLDELSTQVVAGDLDPYSAADRLLEL